MTDNTVDIVKEHNLTSIQLRRKREKIYKRKIPRTASFPLFMAESYHLLQNLFIKATSSNSLIYIFIKRFTKG